MNHLIYKEKYTVYENGDIRGIYGKKLAPRITKFGYNKAVIYTDGKKCNEFVHRIIAKCFIANPENKPQVNHKDGNKLNNSVHNLEWVTNKENQIHSWSYGKRKPTVLQIEACRKLGKKYGKLTGKLMGEKYGKTNTAKKVINTKTGEIHESASVAARLIGVKPATLRSWLTIRKTNKSNYKYINQ